MKSLHVFISFMLLFLLASCSHTKNLVVSSGNGYYPLPGAKVISPYKNDRGSHRHSGVDLKTKPKDIIYAVSDGVVTMSKNYSGYGKCIIIRHADGTETLYAHNSKNYVKEGEKVRGGQKIALTGKTGRATTEHLHFEVRKNGKPVNPMPLLERLSKKTHGK